MFYFDYGFSLKLSTTNNRQRQDAVNLLDQYQYLSNCAPTPPLTQQSSIDNKLRLMLGQGRGKCVVAHILILIQSITF